MELPDRMPISLHLIRCRTRYFHGPEGRPVYVVGFYGNCVRFKTIPIYANSPVLEEHISLFASAVEVGSHAVLRFIRQVHLRTPESEQYAQHQMDALRLHGLLEGHPIGRTDEGLYKSFTVCVRVKGMDPERAWNHVDEITDGGCSKYLEDAGILEVLAFGTDMISALHEDPAIEVVSVHHQHDDNQPVDEPS